MKTINLIFVTGIMAIMVFSGCVEKGQREEGVTTTSTKETTTFREESIEFIEQETGYDEIRWISEVNRKLAYTVKEGKRYLIIYDRKEVGRKYDSTWESREVNGKLCYTAMEGGYEPTEKSKYFVVYGGKEIGKKYYNAWGPTEVNGKLAYTASDGARKFVVYGDKEERDYNREYNRIVKLTEVNGKLAYLAEEVDRWIVVYGGKEIGKKYDTVGEPAEVNGKLTYAAKEDDEYFIVYGDKKIGKKYDAVGWPTEVNGKLTYAAKEGEQWCVVYGSKENKRYDEIKRITEVNNRLAYAAIDKGREFVVYNGQESKKYERVKGPVEVNHKLVFAAEKDDKWYIVREVTKTGVFTTTIPTSLISTTTTTLRNNVRGFARIKVIESSIKYSTNGKLGFTIMNMDGSERTIHDLKIIEVSGSCYKTETKPNTKLNAGQTNYISLNCHKKSEGESVTVDITFNYNMAVAGEKIQHREEGTISGLAEPPK